MGHNGAIATQTVPENDMNATRNYEATIVHSSISRARVIECGTNLQQAKRKASKEFGDELLNARIVIRDSETGATVASRLVFQRLWQA